MKPNQWQNRMARYLMGRYCGVCDHTYFSRCRHDFRSCPCWITSNRKTGGYVDGGRDYLKCGGSGVLIRIPVEQTDQELLQDWKTQKNVYGLLKGRVGKEFSYETDVDKSQLRCLGEKYGKESLEAKKGG